MRRTAIRAVQVAAVAAMVNVPALSGVAPGARLVDCKVLSDAGASVGGSTRGVEWCIANRRTLWAGLSPGSIWQGIDIPGDALQCVVIAKLPFAVPDEPIIEARMERLKNPFREFQIPQATLLFRQGFGRLIRTKADRGAVAVLDSPS